MVIQAQEEEAVQKNSSSDDLTVLQRPEVFPTELDFEPNMRVVDNWKSYNFHVYGFSRRATEVGDTRP